MGLKKEKFLNLIDKTIPIYIGLVMLKTLDNKEFALSNLVAPDVLGITLASATLWALSQPILNHFEKHGAKDLYGYLKNKKSEKAQKLKM